MKKLMILGGLMGFLIGVGFGLAQASEWPSVIWRASIAAYVGGLLLRWWGRIWVQSFQEACEQRENVPAAEAEAPQPSTKK